MDPFIKWLFILRNIFLCNYALFATIACVLFLCSAHREYIYEITAHIELGIAHISEKRKRTICSAHSSGEGILLSYRSADFGLKCFEVSESEKFHDIRRVSVGS